METEPAGEPEPEKAPPRRRPKMTFDGIQIEVSTFQALKDRCRLGHPSTIRDEMGAVLDAWAKNLKANARRSQSYRKRKKGTQR